MCFSPFLFFVCVCVLIIRWLLARFPNPTLTFLSATEKLGIPPTGKQSKRPGRIPALCTNPGTRSVSNRQRGGCENYRQHASRRLSEATWSTPTSGPFYRWGSRVPEGYSDLHKLTPVQSEQNDFPNRFSKQLPQSILQSRQAFCTKSIPIHKEFTMEMVSYKLISHGGFLITKH